MNSENINYSHGRSLIIQFAFGATLTLGTAQIAGRDAWISVIIAVILAIPLGLIYATILAQFPGKDIFDISYLIFGKYVGAAISILYIWFGIHLAALVMRSFGEYIAIVGIRYYDILVPISLTTILVMSALKKGINVLGDWSIPMLSFISFILSITFIALIPEIKIDNIKPIFEKGFVPILRGTFSTISFPFGEMVLFLGVFNNFAQKKDIYKSFLQGIIFSGIAIAIIIFFNISVMGVHQFQFNYFATHELVRILKVGNFIQRIEIVITISFIFGGVIKISICLLASCRGITKVFGLNDYKSIAIPICFLTLVFSYIVYANIQEQVNWAFKVWPFYSFPFEVIIPVFILIFSKIKIGKNKKANVS